MKILNRYNAYVLFSLLIFNNLEATAIKPSKAYQQLLSRFPLTIEQMGCGPEISLPSSDHGQPMTVALLLCSEAERLHQEIPSIVDKQRIHLIIEWILQNSDCDNDGKPGWGLPQAWDTFRNGIINPPNHPYTITTAWALLALTEGLEVLKRHSTKKDVKLSARISQCIRTVILRWNKEMWSELEFDPETTGFYWYSSEPADARFAFNVCAFWCGVNARIMNSHSFLFSNPEREDIENKLDAAVQAIINEVQFSDNLPFWSYESALTGSYKPNDLLHHVYTLHGLELYRTYCNRINIPWCTKQSLDSFKKYWKKEQLLEFIADNTPNQPLARLWAIGSLIAFTAAYGDLDQMEKTYNYLHKNYGTYPDLIYKPNFPDKTFFPRHAAHVREIA